MSGLVESIHSGDISESAHWGERRVEYDEHLAFLRFPGCLGAARTKMTEVQPFMSTDLSILRGGQVLIGDTWKSGTLALSGGVIAPERSSENSVDIDVGHLFLSAGFVDLQINGGWEYDLQADPTSLWDLAARLPEVGVTSFLPTLTTNGHEHLNVALDTLLDGPPAGWSGAQPVGWHLEGPWLAEEKAGAHDRARIAPPPRHLDERICPEGGVRLVTLAPEVDGAIALIGELVGRGVVVSLGHTAATADVSRSGFAAGATVGTHLFNAMGGLHHRSPGLAAALLLDDVWVGLIVDGHHVAPDLVDLAWRLAGPRLVLVSDAVAGMGIRADPVARMADGTLAGSLVGIDQCARNLVDFTGASMAEVLATTSLNPARALGLGDRGTLDVGARADLVALDSHGNVVLTIVNGEIVVDHRSLG
jgi:N-acetylglucosamine-6-phosphate deacetylase